LALSRRLRRTHLNETCNRLRDVIRDESMLARVKIPGVLKSWIPLEADSSPVKGFSSPLPKSFEETCTSSTVAWKSETLRLSA
jgi:hypothetical protein